MDSLYIIGFPSLYGGAGAELYHQIKVWRHMCVDTVSYTHLVLMEQSVTDGWGNVVRLSRASASGGLIHERYSFDTAVYKSQP